MEDIIDLGTDCPDRTGTGCRKLFDCNLTFDLRDGFPAPTVRHTPLRFAFEEFWMFLRGDTDTKYLEERGIGIWKGHTSREFLDSRGLHHLPEGSLGHAYSRQFRNFNGADQILSVIHDLRTNPFSRRHVVTIWNPPELQLMPLTPCWWSHQFVVMPQGEGRKNLLNIKVYSRSSDVLYGLPFNTQQYSLYLLAMAELTGMDPGIVSCNLADAHLYSSQLEYAEETLGRDFYEPCEVTFKRPVTTVDGFLGLTWDDVQVVGHKVNRAPYRAEKPGVAI